MTPKEKAINLVDKFNYEEKHYLMLDAKQCALIAVNEIIIMLSIWDSFNISKNPELIYWQEVKQELENK